ncbi:hypothetical protein DFJ58DRAFT_744177 [Suillus subalutaceus]|uniref:uncharacterized protein n=1 Tax=Suillus subalutaceus TaxID=48586 RepID=UPI001B86D6C4|nr:uncharacterized protein DFJ58DRAFT_744177 [Suillus subalutaceus]KAG1861784.1 hypothetical protein DFJ58DRAFT_744177 [Suillus subalutaceus]
MAMNNCYIDQLPDDALRMIFESVCEEDQATFHDYSMQNEVRGGRYWDDWHQDYPHGYYGNGKEYNGPPPSTLIAAMCVCERWRCLISQTPTLWTVLQISFGDGAASLERVRTFLQLSGTHPLKITLLWNDPHDPFNGATRQASPSYDHNLDLPAPVEESVAGAYLVLIILELHAHVHRWREFTLRTTSKTHIRQALVLLSCPSIHPAHMLEKLHLQLVHSQLDVDPAHHEPSIFPGSASPINDLILFGTSWSWLSPSMFSSHLVNLRIQYCTDNGNRNTATTAKTLLQLLGALINLQTLALELDMDPPSTDTMSPIALPRLHYLAMKSRKMDCWIADFLHYVHMPNLRILTLDGVTCDFMLIEIEFEGIIQELIRLTKKNSSSSHLELDELHLVHFAHHVDPRLLHRLYKQMTSVKVLTLGPGAFFANDTFAMGLLPTTHGLADFPLPGLRTLIVFDIPIYMVRRIVLERLSLAGPLEELYYQEPLDRPEPEEPEELEEYDMIVPDDWQHQVEKYHRIDRNFRTFRFPRNGSKHPPAPSSAGQWKGTPLPPPQNIYPFFCSSLALPSTKQAFDFVQSASLDIMSVEMEGLPAGDRR